MTSSAQSATRCSQLSSASNDPRPQTRSKLHGPEPQETPRRPRPPVPPAPHLLGPSPVPARPTTRLPGNAPSMRRRRRGGPRLADSPGSSDRDEPLRTDEPPDLADVGTTTDQRCQLRGQVVTERGQGAQVPASAGSPSELGCQTCSGRPRSWRRGSPGPRASCQQAAGSSNAAVDAETRMYHCLRSPAAPSLVERGPDGGCNLDDLTGVHRPTAVAPTLGLECGDEGLSCIGKRTEAISDATSGWVSNASPFAGRSPVTNRKVTVAVGRPSARASASITTASRSGHAPLACAHLRLPNSSAAPSGRGGRKSTRPAA